MIISAYSPGQIHKLHLRSTTSRHLIDVREIVRIQSISNYSKLFFNDGRTLVVSKLLRWFEQQLQTSDFVRVHRTHLVNMDYICQYRTDKGGNKLELSNGEQVEVSRRKAGILKSLKEQFVIEKIVVHQAC